MAQYEVTVASIRQLSPTIRELVLQTKDGSPLPAYGPGAHIEVEVTLETGAKETRAYSLLGGTVTGDDPRHIYRIAVERRAEGAGGSRFLCDKVGVGSSL